MDAVGVADGRQAVGDHQGGAALHQPFQRRLHQRLALGVERRGGFVQQQDRRVLQEGAGDGDALALTAGQPQAGLAGAGQIALGQGGDEVVRGGGAPRRPRSSAWGAGAAIGDVGGDGVVEQERLLRHQGDVGAQVVQASARGCRGRSGSRPGGDVIEAGQQAQDGALAAA
jgi:hypothetical protein